MNLYEQLNANYSKFNGAKGRKLDSSSYFSAKKIGDEWQIRQRLWREDSFKGELYMRVTPTTAYILKAFPQNLNRTMSLEFGLSCHQPRELKHLGFRWTYLGKSIDAMQLSIDLASGAMTVLEACLARVVDKEREKAFSKRLQQLRKAYLVRQKLGAINAPLHVRYAQRPPGGMFNLNQVMYDPEAAKAFYDWLMSADLDQLDELNKVYATYAKSENFVNQLVYKPRKDFVMKSVGILKYE